MMSYFTRVKYILYILSAAVILCSTMAVYGAEKKSKTLPAESVVDTKLTALQKQVKDNPSDLSSHIELGKTYLANGMYKNAEREFNAAIKIDSHCSQAYLLSALSVQKHEKPDLKKVLSLLEKAVQIAPDDGAVHLSLAQIYVDMGSSDKAVLEFARAIRLSQDDAVTVSAHLGLMAIYEKQGKTEKSKEEYEAARTIFPGVDEIIKEAEIARLTPSPVYGGGNSGGGEYHPFLQDRIKHAEEEIDKMDGDSR